MPIKIACSLQLFPNRTFKKKRKIYSGYERHITNYFPSRPGMHIYVVNETLFNIRIVGKKAMELQILPQVR